MWFCIDSCGDVETFDTPEGAKKAAVNCLDNERQEASEGWSEEVTQIMWGKVLGRIEETLRRPRTDEDHFVSSICDEVVDYEVVSTDANGEAFAAITAAIGCVRDRRTTAREQGDTDMEKHLTIVVEKLREIRRASR